ncbi:hypothetical protein vseg_004418 [Gypsophila vaccaria]
MMRNPPSLPPQPPQQPPQKPSHLLEINLISAQNLKQPSTNLRRLQTYAAVYVDSSFKLRTRVDVNGAENPTWNDKFIFRVSDDFLRRQTSAVTVDIFAVGVLKDALLGSVRFLVSNVISPASLSVPHAPAFFAVQVRRSSGRFHGVLNLGAVVIDVADSATSSLSAVSAIGYADMMGRTRRRKTHRRGVSEASSGSESWGGDSVDYSDGTESTGSTNSTSSTILKEVNGRKDEKEGRILCGLGFQKKVHINDDDIKQFGSLDLSSA